MDLRPLFPIHCSQMLLIFCLSFYTALGFTDNAVAAQQSDNQAPLPLKVDKNELDTLADANNHLPSESKYSGQVFNSYLYQNELSTASYRPYTDRSLHDGLYLAVAGGYDAYEMQTTLDVRQNGLSLFKQKPLLSASGTSYSLIGGYGRYVDEPLYIGFEAFYNHSHANTSQNIASYQGIEGVYHLKSLMTGTYGISLLPGIKLSDSTLFYVKTGYARITSKTFESSDTLALNNVHSHEVNAIQYGAGLETAIYQNWSIRGEYVHLNGQRFTTPVGTQITYSDNQFMLGILYHFYR